MVYGLDYESMTNKMAEEIKTMIRVSDVIDEIKSIYYGNDTLKKSAYEKLLFLATDTNATPWVEDAFAEWKTNPLTEDDDHFLDIDKLLIIKAFREVRNFKRKKDDLTPVTADEVVAKFLEWMSVDVWNEIHSKREG